MNFFNPLEWLLNPFKLIGCLLGVFVVMGLCSLMFISTTVAAVSGAFQSDSGTSSVNGFTIGGDNSVTLAAKEIAAHLHDCHGMNTSYAKDNGCNAIKFPVYAAYDAGFPQDILKRYSAPMYQPFWASGTFQCVSFVVASYERLHPLETSSDAKYLLGAFTGYPNYQIIASGDYSDPDTAPPVRKLPISPGDIFVMSGGVSGHTGIVLGWQPPHNGKPGEMTIANANAQSPIDKFVINPDNSIAQVGYWSDRKMIGYIHPKYLPVVPPYQTNITKLQYVDVARQAAQDNGVRTDIYLNIIETESHFDPNAVSPAGAIGIAQLIPSTASDLGVDPHDPIASLKGGAKYLKQLLNHYGGNYQQAVAAYNAGPGTVDDAINHHHDDWLSALPQETQNYVRKVLGNL
ncbi:lytic transglycosylase domain-containing protein [Ktedonobacter racemifer]|uniref:Lytic transglycosylase catalytic n=1 Tax=Ktedonobacter racemifer DSM 44963 TaxID=485913 RepID=D6U8N1_KTERA|nr:lytic transglycosylase domain-containing protein [Ktedonobacter racemifer]EFH79591.1 Lytic transglycosylase catalytic [Ktedonobacter racemifer DSM 44963]